MARLESTPPAPRSRSANDIALARAVNELHSEADLCGAQFENVRIESCDLAAADLRGIAFALCILRGVVLTGVRLRENHFRGTVPKEVVGLADDARRPIEREGGAFDAELAHRRHKKICARHCPHALGPNLFGMTIRRTPTSLLIRSTLL
jgi:hypothetical protein